MYRWPLKIPYVLREGSEPLVQSTISPLNAATVHILDFQNIKKQQNIRGGLLVCHVHMWRLCISLIFVESFHTEESYENCLLLSHRVFFFVQSMQARGK